MYAEFLECLHLDDGVIDVVQHQALREFEVKHVRVNLAPEQCLTYLLDKIRLAELTRTDIDGKLQVSGVYIAFPSFELGTGGFQYPLADRQDQYGFLGQRDELQRRDQAALGMLPPY